jgi:serine kinase of HPr protein (carbohydrate metabolism regulator)
VIVHAGCVAQWWPDGWRAALVAGASGAGKSDLALRLIEMGWRLVSDDRSRLWRSGGRLFAAAPEPLQGLIEIRGLGLRPEPALAFAEVRLKVICLSDGARPERLPEPEAEEILGAPVPLVRLEALESSAPFKLGRAIASLGGGAQRAYQASAAISRAGGESR